MDDLDERIYENNPGMRERVALRKAIALAYHERWCGRPPSCGGGTCSGQMDAKALDAVMGAIPVEKHFTTADGTQGTRRGVRAV